jgi:xylulokinase
VKDSIQSNARGAALIASVALGHIRFSDIPELVTIKNVFDPDPRNRALYDDLFEVFVEIYKKNKGIYARLNRRRG